MNPRDQVFASIRRALGVTSHEASRRAAVDDRLESAPRGLIPQRGQLPQPERIKLFRDMLTAAQATVTGVEDEARVPAAIRDYLMGQNLPLRLRHGSDPRLARLPWRLAPLARQDGPSDGYDEVGLSHAETGIAESGTLVVLSGPDNPTTLSFLPDTHIVLVEARTIVGDPETSWTLLRDRVGRLWPRTVNWISGPSRSADIEQQILLGAHGPRRLHVIILGINQDSLI